MQHDEVIWQCINQGHCCFKVKLVPKSFCRNPYNVSGLCLRSACPLANSRYATIKEHEGRVYLYLKTIERAHSPKNLWEKIKLSRNYTKALATVSEQLQYFPKYLQHRNKQRLTKIHQMLIRMRKLKLKTRPKLVAVNQKEERRLRKYEAKALRAAKLEHSIKGELLTRLKAGTYGDIYNFEEETFKEALDDIQEQEESESESESEAEFVEAYDEELMSDDDIEDGIPEFEMEEEYEDEAGEAEAEVAINPRRKRQKVDLAYDSADDDDKPVEVES